MGDALMLDTVIDAVTERIGNAVRFVAPYNKGSYIERARKGMYQSIWQGSPFRLARLVRPLLARYKETYGIVEEREYDTVLDFMGFRYGDVGVAETERAADDTKRWKRLGAKVFFLPQAFGPFRDPRTRRSIKIVHENCDAIYARDPISMEHLVNAIGTREKLYQCPDITIPICPKLKKPDDRCRGKFVVIPNLWMLHRTNSDISSSYFRIISECISAAASQSVETCIVMHSGFQDEQLIAPLENVCDIKLDVVREANPQRLKAMLGTAGAILSSRYHGLIAGLSQGVPSMGTSWSHKYAGLFNDFQIPHLLVEDAHLVILLLLLDH